MGHGLVLRWGRGWGLGLGLALGCTPAYCSHAAGYAACREVFSYNPPIPKNHSKKERFNSHWGYLCTRMVPKGGCTLMH